MPDLDARGFVYGSRKSQLGEMHSYAQYKFIVFNLPQAQRDEKNHRGG